MFWQLFLILMQFFLKNSGGRHNLPIEEQWRPTEKPAGRLTYIGLLSISCGILTANILYVYHKIILWRIYI